jgi:small subunit ribosomal protein S16
LAVVLRCQRRGRTNRPFFRVVAADERAKNDGRVVEVLGFYDPIAKPDKRLSLDAARCQYWVGVGAQITDTVRSLLKEVGVQFPIPKKRERNRPKGKKGVGGATRKPARFKKKVGRLKRAAAKSAAATAAAATAAAATSAAATSPAAAAAQATPPAEGEAPKS